MRKVVCGLFGFGSALCLQAGVWQIQRKRWKEGLIASREKILTVKGVGITGKPFPWVAFPDEDWEYRRVTVSGKFLHSREMLMMRGQEDQKGYKLYTPLMLADGSVLIVNRGWVPDDMKSWRVRKEPDGVVTVEGVLRASDNQGKFTPDNIPRVNEWHYANLPQMMAAAGISDSDALRFYVQSVDFSIRLKYGYDEKVGEPVPSKPGELMNWWATPETHATYAAFWFASSTICFWFLIRALRHR